MKPNFELTSVRVAADKYFGSNMPLGLSAGHLLSGGATTFGLTLARRFERISFGLDGMMSFPERNYSVGLRLGLSFGRNPIDRTLFTARPGLASSGAAAFRVFDDVNGNGVLDLSEPPLEGVSLIGGGKSAVTDAAGMAFFDGLGDGQRIAIQLDETTLPDVDMAARREGIEIVPRAGRIHAGSFAVIGLSEITGIAVLGNERKELSGLLLELLDADGTIAANARTSTGGLFSFERVRPGSYRIVLNVKQASKLGIALKEETHIVVSNNPSVVRTVLFVSTHE